MALFAKMKYAVLRILLSSNFYNAVYHGSDFHGAVVEHASAVKIDHFQIPEFLDVAVGLAFDYCVYKSALASLKSLRSNFRASGMASLDVSLDVSHDRNEKVQ